MVSEIDVGIRIIIYSLQSYSIIKYQLPGMALNVNHKNEHQSKVKSMLIISFMVSMIYSHIFIHIKKKIDFLQLLIEFKNNADIATAQQ